MRTDCGARPASRLFQIASSFLAAILQDAQSAKPGAVRCLELVHSELRERVMRKCANCHRPFGLVRHYWFRTQFCSKRCRRIYLDKAAQDRERMARWLGFLRPT